MDFDPLEMLMKDLVDRESTTETTDSLRRAGEALMDVSHPSRLLHWMKVY